MTFFSKRAGCEGRAVLYVTGRCVLALREDGLEIPEVAPGVDIQKQTLELLPFEPRVHDPKHMLSTLFQPQAMELRDSISDIRIEDRISYTPQTNTLFLDFAGMRVYTP